MVTIQEITKAQMLALYARGGGSEFVNVGDRIYARTTEGMANSVDGYKVVWCPV